MLKEQKILVFVYVYTITPGFSISAVNTLFNRES